LVEKVRCSWVRLTNPLYVRYHDEEWGVPSHDDRHLFEMLLLEGAQAGLSWETILNKRAAYRRAFDRFDPRRIAAYDPAKVASLLADPGIVRNRLKVAAAITNARAFLELKREHSSLEEYLWTFVGGEPKQNHWKRLARVPARTPESDALAKALAQRGFKFVGSTICYAFMQAVGMVNDHAMDCFRRAEVRQLVGSPSPRARAPRAKRT
jgi:DNA-3-methyladenine glycosylase I